MYADAYSVSPGGVFVPPESPLREPSDLKGVPISVDLPASMVLRVTETDPAVKGDTRTNALKPATLETGVVVQVPLFVEEGDRVKVDTRSGDYIERVKA